MNNNIEYCPFCGGVRAEVINALESQPEMELVGLTHDNWNVVCPDCYACGGTRRTAGEAIDAWNMRVTGKKEIVCRYEYRRH